MEGTERDYLAVADLLRYLSQSSILTVDQLEKGLTKLLNRMDDLLLDSPQAVPVSGLLPVQSVERVTM